MYGVGEGGWGEQGPEREAAKGQTAGRTGTGSGEDASDETGRMKGTRLIGGTVTLNATIRMQYRSEESPISRYLPKQIYGIIPVWF